VPPREVFNVLTQPDGTPIENAVVEIRLIANTTTQRGEGFVTSTQESILWRKHVSTDADGRWEANLQPNSEITPDGTVYLISEDPPGRAKAEQHYISVPDTAGPHWLYDILTEAPASLASSALELHRDSVKDHEDWSDSAPSAGQVPIWNGSAYVPGDTVATDIEAAALVTAHNADTTDVHGIPDTSALMVEGDGAGGVLSGTYPSPGFAVDMAPQAELDSHISDATAAHAASAISVTPTGGLAADDVQEALSELQSDLDAKQALSDVGIGHEPLPLLNAKVTAAVEIARPVDVVDGVLYGRGLATNTNRLYRSSDDGTTWETVTTLPTGGAISAVREMGNGEVIVAGGGGLYRSTGWAANPLTATWTLAVSPTAGAAFISFGLDVYGQYVLVAEYVNPKDASKKLRLSTDYGVTFTDVRNLDTMHPTDIANTHWHGAAIDPWADTPSGVRLWASYGDGPRGVIYSDDEGATWTTFSSTWQPTTIKATEHGMVLSTDANDPDGVWRILRTEVAANMVREQIYAIRDGYRAGGLYGFASHSFYDPDSKLVYIAFNSNIAGVPSRILVSDGIQATQVWMTSTTTHTGITSTGNVMVTSGRKVVLSYVDGNDSSTWVLTADASHRGTATGALRDPGGVLTGSASTREAIGIGARVVAGQQSVIIGTQASGGTRSTVIGESAVGGADAVVIGQGVSSAFQYAVAIGIGASAGATETVAVGRSASASAAQSVAVGPSAASVGLGVSIGYLSTTSGLNAVAVGPSASAAVNGVAVGSGAIAPDRGVAIGQGANTGAGVQSTAVGAGAVCGAAAYSIALGRSASATAEDGIAIGRSATVAAGWNRSIALGQGVAATAADQVRIATKHFELDELSADPAAPAANRVRFYAKDNGAGKTGLYARFNTGAVQQVALEP
jgi:hypothetical protein